jgi:site-specific DNA-methyltransferase (adenine-specific)
MTPFYQDDSTTLYLGDALAALREMPDDSVDGVVTDPPYSSGGMFRGDRIQKTSDKYVIEGTILQRPEFLGDNRDQRSFFAWATLWLSECLRVTKPGGALLCFTDWRQLPTVTDAIQAGGWIWRGIIPWDKTEGARPQKGWFRAQCEYVITSSHGSLGKEQDRDGVCSPGFFRGAPNPAEKFHITGKPVALMESLLAPFAPGSIILDPFAGGGSTLIAAKQKGLQSIGVELDPVHCHVIKRRLSQGALPIYSPA